MATQLHCDSAQLKLVARIRASAAEAGIDSPRAMQSATTVREGEKVSYVAKSTVSKIWRLESYPTFDTLLALARACGCSVSDWLSPDMVQGEPPDTPEEPPETPEGEPEDVPEDVPEPPEDEGEPEDEPAPSESKVDVMALLHGMRPD